MPICQRFRTGLRSKSLDILISGHNMSETGLKQKVDAFQREAKERLAKIETYNLPDSTAPNLFEEMEMRAKNATASCEHIKYDLYRVFYGISDKDFKQFLHQHDLILDMIYSKFWEYLEILTAIRIARNKIREGETMVALHLASVAGASFPGYSQTKRFNLQTMLENLKAGREIGTKTRSTAAQRKESQAKTIISDLFTSSSYSGRPGVGWGMSKTDIYQYLRSKGVGWSEEYSKKKLSRYIDEVKANTNPL